MPVSPPNDRSARGIASAWEERARLVDEFYRLKRLPPYVFSIVNDLKAEARARGEDIVGTEHRLRQATRGIRALVG